jgi:hypothetical protein
LRLGLLLIRVEKFCGQGRNGVTAACGHSSIPVSICETVLQNMIERRAGKMKAVPHLFENEGLRLFTN